MKRQLLALIMIFCLILGALPFGALAQENGEEGIAPAVEEYTEELQNNLPEDQDAPKALGVPAEPENPAAPETPGIPEEELVSQGPVDAPDVQSLEEENGIALQADASRHVSTYTELKQAVDDGVQEIIFDDDITCNVGKDEDYAYFKSGGNVTLNLNGHTFSNNSFWPTIQVDNGTRLTISGGTVSSLNRVLRVRNGTVVVESSATLSGASYAPQSSESDDEKNYCVLIDQGSVLALRGQITDTKKEETLVKNYGGFVIEPGAVVDGKISNNNTGLGCYVFGGTVLGEFTNYGKVELKDFQGKGYGYFYQGGNGTRFESKIYNKSGGSINGGVADKNALLVNSGGTVTRFASWTAMEYLGDNVEPVNFFLSKSDAYSICTLHLVGNAVTEQPEDPVKEGFRFDGWYDDKGTKFTFGKPFTPLSEYLFAQFTDIAKPTIAGLENGKTYCKEVSFTVSDNVGVTSVTFNGSSIIASGGVYKITGPKSGVVMVKDAAGNETSVTVTVNADHTTKAANCQRGASCSVCGAELTTAKDPTNHTQEAQWEKTQQGHRKHYPCCNTYEPTTGYAAHTYSDGVCDTCQYVCSHAGENVTWDTDATTHTKHYVNCGKTEPAAPHNWNNGVCQDCGYQCQHTGGTATCMAKAQCETCGELYGELDPDNHEQTNFVSSADGHYAEHPCCHHNGDFEPHRWNAGTCEVCRYTHICGEEAGHWESDGDRHEYVRDICGKREQKGTHTAQTEATCTSKAVCSVCQLEYGDVNPNNHTRSPRWICTEQTHKQHYDCCDAEVNSGNHRWSNGVCADCQYVCGHTGGTATCKTRAKCEICKEFYGNLDGDNHEKAAIWVKTELVHRQYYPCCDADIVAQAEHVGGTATCQEKAVCTVCGTSYGEIDPNHHTMEAVWDNDFDTHWRYYRCCHQDIIPKAAHTGGTATCKLPARCEVCNNLYGMPDPSNHAKEAVWITTADTHKQVYPCCDTVIVPETAHNGGTAGCTRQAKCTACGESYGSLNPDAHLSMCHVPAASPTTWSNGNREYWYCPDCGKYFLNASGEKETTRDNLILPRVEVVTDENPKTGDLMLLIPCGVLLVFSGVALAIIRKKRT